MRGSPSSAVPLSSKARPVRAEWTQGAHMYDAWIPNFLSEVSLQYRGKEGSTAWCHCVRPPCTLRACRQPWSRSRRVACVDRTPRRHMTYTVWVMGRDRDMKGGEVVRKGDVEAQDRAPSVDRTMLQPKHLQVCARHAPGRSLGASRATSSSISSSAPTPRRPDSPPSSSSPCRRDKGTLRAPGRAQMANCKGSRTSSSTGAPAPAAPAPASLSEWRTAASACVCVFVCVCGGVCVWVCGQRTARVFVCELPLSPTPLCVPLTSHVIWASGGRDGS